MSDFDWCIRYIYSSRAGIILHPSLIKYFGLDATVVLSALINKYDSCLSHHSAKRADANMLQDDNSFYYTVPCMEQDTGLSKYHQVKALRILRVAGFIYNHTKPGPVGKEIQERRYIIIHWNVIRDFFVQLVPTTD